MAFSSTITSGVPRVRDGKLMTWGTFTNAGGSTGGNIDTDLAYVDQMFLQHSGAAAIADQPSVNETLPVAGSAVTIVTTADKSGYWMAIGRN